MNKCHDNNHTCRPIYQPVEVKQTCHTCNKETTTCLVECLDCGLKAEAKLALLRAALEEIMPRYVEMFVRLGLGDPQQSVAVRIAKEALGAAEGETAG